MRVLGTVVIMIRLCYGRSHELMWSWGYGQCCPQQQCTISVQSCTHSIGNISWNRQDSIIWNTQAQIISAIYESMFPCLRDLSRQYILGEVFLYSDCDIYDTQTTTNPTRYIAPIYCLSRKIGGHLELCILKPAVHQNCNLHIKYWLSTLKICKMHVSHKLIPQLICLAMVHSLQNGGHL